MSVFYIFFATAKFLQISLNQKKFPPTLRPMRGSGKARKIAMAFPSFLTHHFSLFLQDQLPGLVSGTVTLGIVCKIS